VVDGFDEVVSASTNVTRLGLVSFVRSGQGKFSRNHGADILAVATLAPAPRGDRASRSMLPVSCFQ
jgi:hypothetical protein